MERIKLISTNFAILVMLFVGNSFTVSRPTNINTDQLSLLSLKAHVTDPGNVISTNWSVATPVCSWIGVTCNTRHHRVAVLDLHSLGLSGTIPSHFGNLSFLVHLDLHNNSLHGSIPNELRRLRRLNHMDLGYNYLDGDLPGWLSLLAKLQFLSLNDNKFSGSLAPELSNLTMLRILDLSTNLLTGNVPEQWGTSFSKLRFLSMESNKLTGQFPLTTLNMSSLEVVSFQKNSLSGQFPRDICHSLSNLDSLYLSHNDLNGRIPSSINFCSKLQSLFISDNKLKGPIPREIGNLTSLQKLYMGSNNLEEYGVGGRVSRQCDVYSYGIVLMETFTGRRPSNSMFTGDITLKSWVKESIPNSVSHIVDPKLLHHEGRLLDKEEQCVCAILELAVNCTKDSAQQRGNMKDVEATLRKIRLAFLASCH